MNPLPRYIAGLALLLVSVFSASADPNPKAKVFEAEIIHIRMLSKFTGTVKLAAIDPRFVLEVRLRDDVEGLGKRGATVAFAIHSPARDLWISDYSTAVGKVVRLSIFKKADAKRFYLRREVITAEGGADQSTTAPKRKSRPKKNAKKTTKPRSQ